MWKGGFMKNYIINEDILCFTSDSDGKLLVMEKDRKINIVGTGLKFIKKRKKKKRKTLATLPF